MFFRSLFYSGTLTLLTCSQGLLIAASKTKRGSYGYSTLSANMSVELLKLLLSFSSLFMLRWRSGLTAHTSLRLPVSKLIMYPIPAALYLVKNLLQYTILLYVQAPSYQILKNMNVLTTALLYSLVLQKYISKLEWCSLVLLSIGCVVSQLQSDSNNLLQLSATGLLLSIVMASLSSLAGVYTEFIMKKDDTRHVSIQNIYLYTFGIFFNFVAYYGQMRSTSFDLRNFFKGYSPFVWLMIFNQAFSGIAVSYVMKYENNLTKVKATSLAVVLTTLLSVVFLDFTLEVQFILGFLTVIISLYIPKCDPREEKM